MCFRSGIPFTINKVVNSCEELYQLAYKINVICIFEPTFEKMLLCVLTVSQMRLICCYSSLSRLPGRSPVMGLEAIFYYVVEKYRLQLK